MDYLKKNLMLDEKIAYQTRLHWIVYAPWLALSACLGVMLFVFRTDPTMRMVIMVLFVVCSAKTFFAFLRFFTSEVGITNKRVLGKTGFLLIESVDIMLNKVEAFKLHQSLFGYLLNYGHVEVIGIGGTKEVLELIPRPAFFRNNLEEQAVDLRQRHALSASPFQAQAA